MGKHSSSDQITNAEDQPYDMRYQTDHNVTKSDQLSMPTTNCSEKIRDMKYVPMSLLHGP